MTQTLWPAGIRAIRSPGDRVSGTLHVRLVAVVGILIVLTVIVSVWSLTVGETAIPIDQVIAALTGNADPGTTRIVTDWRLSRIVMAVVAGAGLALAGAVFQTLTRNPLGSPDIIGFNVGAYTGVLVVAIVFGGGYTASALGALVGGLATAVVVYVFAFRGGLSGYRFIIVGIGIAAMLTAFNTFLIQTADLQLAISASIWGAGSLSDTGWNEVLPVTVVLIVLVPLLVIVAPYARMLDLGDDAAAGFGVRVETTRLALLIIGVVLTAAVTAAAGPIAFVALAAPQIAVRLAGVPSVPLTASAATGALLLVSSDLVARTVIAPSQLPVGVVTICLGGVYLLWLLISASRKK